MNGNELMAVKCLMRESIFRNRYELVIPNCYTQFDNEADVFAIRKKSHYSDEIEIKVTRSDFLADANKLVNYRDWLPGEYHRWLKTRKPGEIEPTIKPKLQALKDGDMTPNYFWYCVPRGMVSVDEIPLFAGLIEFSESGISRFTKAPKLLHRRKMSFEQCYKAARKMAFRYWDQVLDPGVAQ